MYVQVTTTGSYFILKRVLVLPRAAEPMVTTSVAHQARRRKTEVRIALSKVTGKGVTEIARHPRRPLGGELALGGGGGDQRDRRPVHDEHLTVDPFGRRRGEEANQAHHVLRRQSV